MAKVAGMHKGKLVIYTLFTDTQFTTKTKQINISLTSVGGPSLGRVHTLVGLRQSCMSIIFQQSEAKTSRQTQTCSNERQGSSLKLINPDENCRFDIK